MTVEYDPGLVERLKKHHRTLLKLLDDAAQSAEKQRFSAVTKSVAKFHQAFEEHLYIENRQFYSYLSNFVNDDDHRDMMETIKRDMKDVGEKVSQFIRHHQQEPVNADNLDRFKEDLGAIRTLLAERIDEEEDSLYTLYLPAERG